MKKRAALAVLAFMVLSGAAAFEPSLQLSTGLSSGIGRVDGGTWDAEPVWDAGGLFLWRTRLADKSFLTLAYQLSGSLSLETARPDDSHFLLVRGLTPLGEGVLDLSLESRASFLADETGNTRYIYPVWEVAYTWDRPRKSPEPFLLYRGRYDGPEAAAERALENRAAAGIRWSPSFRNTFTLQAAYAYRGFLSNETSTGILRGDHIIALEAGAAGLLGFYAEYELDLTGSLLFSNENRYIDFAIEERSEDRLSLGLAGDLTWTPRRRLDISAGVEVKEDYYLVRKALLDNGSPSGENLSLLLVEAEFGASFALTEAWRLSAEVTGSKSFSDEALYRADNIELALWAEYAL